MNEGRCGQGGGHCQSHPSPPISYSGLSYLLNQFGIEDIGSMRFATNLLMIDRLVKARHLWKKCLDIPIGPPT